MFSLVRNHTFVNKRAGHTVAETFLLLNGFEIEAPGDGQERGSDETSLPIGSETTS